MGPGSIECRCVLALTLLIMLVLVFVIVRVQAQVNYQHHYGHHVISTVCTCTSCWAHACVHASACTRCRITDTKVISTNYQQLVFVLILKLTLPAPMSPASLRVLTLVLPAPKLTAPKLLALHYWHCITSTARARAPRSHLHGTYTT